MSNRCIDICLAVDAAFVIRREHWSATLGSISFRLQTMIECGRGYRGADTMFNPDRSWKMLEFAALCDMLIIPAVEDCHMIAQAS